MPHYRSMFESNGMLYACHLDGKDVTVTISKVEAGTITGSKGKKDKKPLVSFEGKQLKLGLNKTNGKTIAAMYGPNTDEWIGKRISLYATTTEFGSETVECIRVRPKVPPAARQSKSAVPVEQPTATIDGAEESEPGASAEENE